MTKLEKLAVRISEISDEILEAKNRREINLNICHGSIDEDFESSREPIDHSTGQKENCLYTAYQYVSNDREEGLHTSFIDTLDMYGCVNCKGAHKAKRDISRLKQERGRVVGNISKIGKSL